MAQLARKSLSAAFTNVLTDVMPACVLRVFSPCRGVVYVANLPNLCHVRLLKSLVLAVVVTPGIAGAIGVVDGVAKNALLAQKFATND